MISVRLPRNISEDERYLFSPYSTYGNVSLTVEDYKDIFVSPPGFCIDKNGLMEVSHICIPSELQNQKKTALYFYDKAKSPDNVLFIEDQNVHVVIHYHFFSNYYHWMTDGLLRLWLIKDRMKDLILIQPEVSQKLDCLMSALEPFQFKGVYVFPESKSLVVKNLCIPQINPNLQTFYRKYLHDIRTFYLDYFAKKRM